MPVCGSYGQEAAAMPALTRRLRLLGGKTDVGYWLHLVYLQRGPAGSRPDR
jgi:hypothetical protein